MGQLRLAGRFIFGEMDRMFFTKRAPVSVLCEEGKSCGRLELRNCLGHCIVLSKCSFPYTYGVNYMLRFVSPGSASPSPPIAWVSGNNPPHLVAQGKRLGWHFFECSPCLSPYLVRLQVLSVLMSSKPLCSSFSPSPLLPPWASLWSS